MHHTKYIKDSYNKFTVTISINNYSFSSSIDLYHIVTKTESYVMFFCINYQTLKKKKKNHDNRESCYLNLFFA